MKRLVKPFLIGLGILLLGIILLAADVARFGGAFRSVENRFSGTCSDVPLGGSSEDIRIDGERGVAYLSVLDRASLARSEPVNGTVMLLDLNAGPAPRAAMAYDPPGFRPHGLALFRPTGAPLRLFAISHRPDGSHAVEIAEQDPGGAFVPRESVTDDWFVQPGAIAAVGPRQFYLANDSGAETGAGRRREVLFRRGLATLLFHDGIKTKIVEHGLRFPRGLAVSPDGSHLYVSEGLARQLRVYRIDPANGDLTLDETVPLDSSPGNLNVDSDGVLWIAAHPKLLSLYSHLRHPENRAPSQVLRFDPRTARPAAGESDARLTRVYDNDGTRISAASSAAHWRNEFLVGALFDHKVLICKPNP